MDYNVKTVVSAVQKLSTQPVHLMKTSKISLLNVTCARIVNEKEPGIFKFVVRNIGGLNYTY